MFLLVNQFRATMDALEELHDAIVPHAAQLAEERASVDRWVAEAELSSMDRRTIVQAFERMSERLEATSTPGSAELGDEDSTAPTTNATSGDERDTPASDSTRNSTSGVVEQRDEDEEHAEPHVQFDPETENQLQEMFGRNPLAMMDFTEAVLRHAVSSPHQILNGSLLIVAVATFESLLARLVSVHLTRFPASMDGDEKEFSLTDLAKYDSLDDAREAAISSRVESFMRRGLDDWSRWSDRTLKLPLDQVVPDYSEFTEIFQRRHIIVHNGGRVSRLYLANTKDESVTLEEPLPVTDEYLVRSMRVLHLAGSALAVTAWQKWATPDEAAAARRTLTQYMYSHVKAGRWAVVRHFCGIVASVAGTESNRQVLQVNAWLARKRLEDTSAIRSEVEAWDTSAASVTFRLAKAALLDDFDAAIPLIEKAIGGHEVSVREVFSWPLLAEIRERPEFADAMGKYPEEDQN
jgi:hypothetical protein